MSNKVMLSFSSEENARDTKTSLIQHLINRTKVFGIQFDFTKTENFANTDVISIAMCNGQPLIILPYSVDSPAVIKFVKYQPTHSLSYIDKPKFKQICDRLEAERLIDIDDLIYLLQDDLQSFDDIDADNPTSSQVIIQKREMILAIYNNIISKLRLDIVRDIYLDGLFNVLDTIDDESIRALSIVRMIRSTTVVNVSLIDTLTASLGFENTTALPAEVFITSDRDGHPTVSLYDKNYEIKN